MGLQTSVCQSAARRSHRITVVLYTYDEAVDEKRVTLFLTMSMKENL